MNDWNQYPGKHLEEKLSTMRNKPESGSGSGSSRILHERVKWTVEVASTFSTVLCSVPSGTGFEEATEEATEIGASGCANLPWLLTHPLEKFEPGQVLNTCYSQRQFETSAQPTFLCTTHLPHLSCRPQTLPLLSIWWTPLFSKMGDQESSQKVVPGQGGMKTEHPLARQGVC